MVAENESIEFGFRVANIGIDAFDEPSKYHEPFLLFGWQTNDAFSIEEVVQNLSFAVCPLWPHGRMVQYSALPGLDGARVPALFEHSRR